MQKIFRAALAAGKYSDVYSSSSLSELDEKLREYDLNSIFVFDDNTKDLINRDNRRCVILNSGEEYKSFDSIKTILDKAIDVGLSRDSVFVAVGGGVVCDMTAFAASVYMRGARAVLVPTTLLSQVDASVGGKSGIDYRSLKNIVGSFFPAETIIICSEALKTLPEDEFISGLGEVVKHAFLSPNSDLYDFLEANRDKILSRDSDILSRLLYESLLVKKHFIEQDPEEKKGIRSFLNLGHTFGHALESITDYKVKHGIGVAWGCAKAADAGAVIGITDKAYGEKMKRLLSIYPFNADYKVSKEELPDYLAAIKNDKKKKGGEVKYVFMKGQGEPVLSPLSDAVAASVVS